MALLAGKYQLGEKIGGGGMAEVFRAEVRGAEGFAKPVAVKRMLRSLSAEPGFGQMFVAEARIASQLVHPNIGTVIDFDVDDEGRYFLVMELIDGVDLRQLAATGRLPIACTAHVMASVLRALDHAHEHRSGELAQGVVHRDVSPHNIMVAWNGAVQLLDFGIAKVLAATSVSQSGSLKGKVAYMSPEQAHGRDLDGRSDLFAAGIVFHELLVAQRLFLGETDAETLSLMLTAPVAPPSQRAPDVPEAIDRIVMRLLERDRERRYPSAREALKDLFASGVIPAGIELQLEALMGERFGRTRASSTPPKPAGAETQLGQPGNIALADTVQSDPLPLGTERGMGPGLAPASHPTPAVPAATVTHRGGHLAPPRPETTAPSRKPLILAAAAALLLGLGGVSLYLATRGDSSSGASADAADLASAAPFDATAAIAGDDAAAGSASADAGAEAAGGESSGDARGGDPDDDDRGEKPDDDKKKKERGEPARLTLRATPWATVSVDGKTAGQTPLTIELDPGRHKVVFENADLGRKEKRRVRLRAGGEKTITVEF